MWVTDGTAEPIPPPEGLQRILPAVNKADLAPSGGGLRVSALTGAGLDTMAAVIVAALVPDPPPPGAAVQLPREMWRALP
jgi:hypothetical protein